MYASDAKAIGYNEQSFLLTEIDSMQGQQPLRGLEFQEKEAKKIKVYRKSVQKEPAVKRSQLILDLKPFRSNESIL